MGWCPTALLGLQATTAALPRPLAQDCMAVRHEAVQESVPENAKNMLLVLASSGILTPSWKVHILRSMQPPLCPLLARATKPCVHMSPTVPASGCGPQSRPGMRALQATTC